MQQDRKDALEYIADMTAQLSTLAKNNHLLQLNSLLDAARQNASAELARYHLDGRNSVG